MLKISVDKNVRMPYNNIDESDTFASVSVLTL